MGIRYLSVVLYVAITVVAALSVRYSFLLYDSAPLDLRESVRLLLAATSTLGIASMALAVMLVCKDFGLAAETVFHAAVLVFVTASMSFWLALSFQVKGGKL